MKNKLLMMYNKLHRHFGPQNWWPAESPFEVMVGAILTQNTSWSNVEKAIDCLKNKRLLSVTAMLRIPKAKLAASIKPAGYYNIKSGRLKDYLRYFLKEYKGRVKKMRLTDTHDLRAELLSVRGIGPETADSILLYALEKPVFVIDAYTKRILSRHGFFKDDIAYQEAQSFFMTNLKKDVKLFNEFHALLVNLAKSYCRKRRPLCEKCPLR